MCEESCHLPDPTLVDHEKGLLALGFFDTRMALYLAVTLLDLLRRAIFRLSGQVFRLLTCLFFLLFVTHSLSPPFTSTAGVDRPFSLPLCESNPPVASFHFARAFSSSR